MKIIWKKYYFLVFSESIVRRLGRLVSLGNNAMALTVWPFVFMHPQFKESRVFPELLQHEEIHIRQQLELLVVGALFLYVFEYLYARVIKKLDSRQAYYYTALEQEAHRNAYKPHYLKTRKPYSWVRYLWEKKKLGRDEIGALTEEDSA